MNKILSIALVSALIFNSCKNSGTPKADDTFEKQLQEKFVNAKDGDVIELPEGEFLLTRPLILDKVKNVTIKGKGKDKTTLSFKGQKDGAEGLRITADGIVLEDFAILDPKGDCIKVQDATNVTMRRLRTGWTSLHDSKNGSYGTYPVSCTNVLIEECEVFGSSDAGIYVGQSKNIVVRKNHVHDNVAGIEIENCVDADVYENLSENNTGGMLVFDLPDLPVKNGQRCRVYNNKFINNNTKNFGVKGTTVAEIPAGTGVIVMATNFCDVFNNEILNNNTVSAAVISYTALQKPFKDSLYDPFCGGIHVYDNKIQSTSSSPDKSTEFGKMFAAAFGDKVPALVWDGATDPAYNNTNGTVKDEQRVCFRNNGDVEFSNLKDVLARKKTDPKSVDCTLQPLSPVKLIL